MLGQFKRGKSTLINALLGDALLPTAMVPLTSIVTDVRDDPRRAARIEFQDGHIADIALGQLAEYITEPGNPRNGTRVARALLTAPAPLLGGGGLRVIDTPGIGSTHEHNSAIARDFVPQADAEIFVLSVEPPIGELEARLLRDVSRFTQ